MMKKDTDIHGRRSGIPCSCCPAARKRQMTVTLPAAKDSGSEKIQIVATLFPQYDFARQIAGDKADVRLLLPPGVESHSYEPTPSDIIKINDSDLFIYTGKYMEAWSGKIIDSMKDSGVEKYCAGRIAGRRPLKRTKTRMRSILYDPHIWTDPH